LRETQVAILKNEQASLLLKKNTRDFLRLIAGVIEDKDKEKLIVRGRWFIFLGGRV